jgi:type II secretory pathway pseudopilin PulG
MLISIAIIGYLSSIVVPNVSGSLMSSVREIHDRRNAQEIAGLAQMAHAVDLDFVVEGNLRGTVLNLMDGVEVMDGAFRGSTFRLENRLSSEDLTNALRFLALNGGEVTLNIPGSGY